MSRLRMETTAAATSTRSETETDDNAALPLLGPPEIYLPPTTPRCEFVDFMVSDFNKSV